MQVQVPWDVIRYSDRLTARSTGRNVMKEEELSRRYPPLSAEPFPMVNAPCIIIDIHGVILGWYLPEVLSLSRQV